jgi:hypothetical protein
VAQNRNQKPSQNDRVQRALELQGSIGITQQDFTPPNVIDGMDGISRIGARIHDLKTKRGLIFDESAGERDGFQVYRLAATSSDGETAAAQALAGAHSGSLFDMPPAGPANALVEG